VGRDVKEGLKLEKKDIFEICDREIGSFFLMKKPWALAEDALCYRPSSYSKVSKEIIKIYERF